MSAVATNAATASVCSAYASTYVLLGAMREELLVELHLALLACVLCGDRNAPRRRVGLFECLFDKVTVNERAMESLGFRCLEVFSERSLASYVRLLLSYFVFDRLSVVHMRTERMERMETRRRA